MTIPRQFLRNPGRTLVFAAAVGVLMICGSATALDLNGNGLSDVWEQQFSGAGFAADGDTDGDSQSDQSESRAGTDPRNASSKFQTTDVRVDGGDVVIRWTSEIGKSYCISASSDLATTEWLPLTAFLPGTGLEMERTLAGAMTPEPRFFRVEVRDEDTDGDGVTDWDEMRLPGFDRLNRQSAKAGVDDLETLSAMLAGPENVLTVSSRIPVAIEQEAVDGVIRITRSGGLKALSVRFDLMGNSNAQRGSATASDYSLRGPNDATISTSVEIPFGVSFVDVIIRPISDSRLEPPETLTLGLVADPSYALGITTAGSVSITDAANTPANERLFIAYLSPLSTGTTATGLATARLQGDNAIGKVDLSFSALSSPQTTAFLDLDNSGAGIYVKGLPFGQVSDNTWQVRAAAFLSTDQEMLDALFAGNVSTVVNSTTFLEGEIRGNFQQIAGSSTPPAPSEPPPIATLSGTALKRDVARFLTQATFGPSEAEIAALAQEIETTHAGNRIAGYRAWINAQFAMDPSTIEAYTRAADAQEFQLMGTTPIAYQTGQPNANNRRRAWWMLAVSARDQLRQRAAFALSEIYIISEKNTQVALSHYGAARFYDNLGARADGNFRDLIEDVSKSPIMGTYLSHLKNQKAIYNTTTGALMVSPDENYAREVMQLFTIGLVQLHPDGSLKLSARGVPIPTYTNTDITELARVLTGWSFSRRHTSVATGLVEEENTLFTQGAGSKYFQASWVNPMKNFIAFHDTGAKTVLGTTIPAGLTGEQDLDAALDVLFNHPNTGPFVSRLLIKRLVTATPSAGYIFRVAKAFEDDGSGTRGNMKAVFTAILLDPEARSLDVVGFVGSGKQKEPIIRYVQLLRAFGATTQLPLADLTAFGYPSSQLDNFPPGVTRMRFGSTDASFGQSPQASPTVFNWFLPDYSPGGALAVAGVVSPEMQITNETQIFQAVNYSRTFLNSTSGQSTASMFGSTNTTLDDAKLDRTSWDAFYNAQVASGKSVTEAVTELVDRLDLLLMAGNLKAKYALAPAPNPRWSIIESGVRVIGTTTTGDRVWNVFYLMGNCPEFLHQK